ncbi:DUF4286 family protein [Novosphingobium pentaromativorans]|uniref:Uncharacterized protein n=1 Tax=Novosphingobium pentaromativorans US6-1 TaxID=1088721 RepID=G6E849_9SPHN|nr:DUF4286 family protein [Novosphingobium pentaromativorans]EHJ62389.1 hypothetical protein NSU_0520 [Novosphingobium pentaromativorans US6-1]
MGKYHLVVYTNPADGKEDEYNSWYNEQHLREVCAVPGFTGARRMKIHDPRDAGEYSYLAVYDIDGDADATMAELRAHVAAGKIYMSDALGPNPKAIVYEALASFQK